MKSSVKIFVSLIFASSQILACPLLVYAADRTCIDTVQESTDCFEDAKNIEAPCSNNGEIEYFFDSDIIESEGLSDSSEFGETFLAESIDEYEEEITDEDDDEGYIDDEEGEELYYYGEFIYDFIGDNQIEIVSYIGEEWEVSIPSSINGIDVVSIGAEAFYNDSNLVIVTLPSSIENILSSAFEGCVNLTTVLLSDGLVSIGDSAFCNCKSLEYVELPSTLQSIGSSAFRNCSLLDSLTIPDSVSSIGSYAFSYCTSLASIVLPSSISAISEGTFQGCSSLYIITFNNGTEELGCLSFDGCSSLLDLVLPDSIKSIGECAFQGCASLIDIYYEGSIDEWNEIDIGTGNDSLKAATVHYHYRYEEDEEQELESTIISDEYPDYSYKILDNDTVSIVGYSGISDTLIIPDKIDGYVVSSIGDAAFFDCTTLKSVTIPNSVVFIDNNAFAYCINLEELIVEEGCEVIEDYAFYSCTSLKTLTFPLTLKDIEYNSFCLCDSISDIYYSGSLEDWELINIQDGNDSLFQATMHYLVGTSSPSSQENKNETTLADQTTSAAPIPSVDDSSAFADSSSNGRTSSFSKYSDDSAYLDNSSSIDTSDTSLIGAYSVVLFSAVSMAIVCRKKRLS